MLTLGPHLSSKIFIFFPFFLSKLSNPVGPNGALIESPHYDNLFIILSHEQWMKERA